MKRSNYLIWFRRLVVLGAVVAGLTASTAGAIPMLDPQDTPIAGTNVPDYGPYPISGGTGFNQVVTWPTNPVVSNTTPLGLRADGLRLQAIAKAYQQNGKTGSAPKADPLAVSYLIGQGLTPNEVTSWTTGACSHQAKAASCYAMFQPAAAPKTADPLAVSYLIGQGLTPNEVTSWTTGACSHQAKAASCYAMFQPAAAPKTADPLAVSYLIGQGLTPNEVTSWTTGACSHQAKAASCYAMFQPASTSSTQVARATGFQWGDAGIGAGIILLLGGASAGLFLSRHNRGQQTARA